MCPCKSGPATGEVKDHKKKDRRDCEVQRPRGQGGLLWAKQVGVAASGRMRIGLTLRKVDLDRAPQHPPEVSKT